MNRAILNTEAQAFIRASLNDDPSRILFKGSPFEDITAKELVEQIESMRASEKKLPTWYANNGIIYPKRLSIEQTSSEITAAYKAELIKGDNIVDLTGGFGVDSYFFSKRASKVTHCEINPALSAIAKHNAKVLGADNQKFVADDGIAFLNHSGEVYDTIYIDPSRRKTDKRVFLLSDCEPDVVAHLDLLLAKAKRIIIKTSPLLDIQSGLKQLKQVSEVHIVSVKNDCKELLWIVDRGFEGEPTILPVAIRNDGRQILAFGVSEERETDVDSFSPPARYLYEPDVALMKAGCFKWITKRYNVKKLNPNTHLYTSEAPVEGFMGRTFEITSVLEYKAFGKNKSQMQANVISRNFPLTPEEIKKKFKVKDGGEDYLIFTSGPNNKLLTIQGRRI